MNAPGRLASRSREAASRRVEVIRCAWAAWKGRGDGSSGGRPGTTWEGAARWSSNVRKPTLKVDGVRKLPGVTLARPVYRRAVTGRTKVLLALCTVSGLAVGAFATYESRDSMTPPVPSAVAASAFERELGVAEALGFVRERVAKVLLPSNDYGIGGYEEAVVIDAGECVAIVAAIEGPYRLQRVGLGRSCAFGAWGSRWESLTQEDSGRGGGGVVAHAQYCSDVREPLRLCVEARPSHYSYDDRSGEGVTATIGIARVSEAALGGRGRLNRGLIAGL